MRVHPSVVCVVGLCVVGGQFLYSGCICAYTMREHPSVVVGLSVVGVWMVVCNGQYRMLLAL